MTSHRSDCDHSDQGFTIRYAASLRLDADQVSEVLKVEEQQVIAKVQERQTLQRRRAKSQKEQQCVRLKASPNSTQKTFKSGILGCVDASFSILGL